LSAEGRKFIFTLSKKRGSEKQLIKLLACRRRIFQKPAERKFGKRYWQWLDKCSDTKNISPYIYQMTKKLILTCFVLTTIISVSQTTATKLYKKHLGTIVKFRISKNDGIKGSGTGFFISEKTIVTCYHVLENAKTIDIYSNNGKKFTLDSILESNKKSDLIRFSVKEKSSSWLTVSKKLPEPGDNIYIIGNPDNYDFSISTGIVSAIRTIDSVEIIQNTAPSSPGISGAPLLNEKGEVIGVQSFISFINQNLNLASSSNEILNMKNDKSFKSLEPIKYYSNFQKDSIYKLIKASFKAQNYKKTIELTYPLLNTGIPEENVQYLEFIGNSYFYLQDYAKAAQYFSVLLNYFGTLKYVSDNDWWSFAQALNTQSLCLFTIGDKEGAVYHISKAIEIANNQINSDELRKDLYKMFLRQVHVSDATFKFSQNKKFEACLSWKIAKQYGQTTDELGFDALCK
jgi:hypothetical protein